VTRFHPPKALHCFADLPPTCLYFLARNRISSSLQQGARLDMYKLSFRRRTLISPSRSLLLAGSLCLLSLGSTALAQEAKKAPVAETKAEAPQPTTVAKPTTATDSEKAEETTEGDDASEVSAAPAAPTDVEIEEARVSFEAGTKAFDEGKFDE